MATGSVAPLALPGQLSPTALRLPDGLTFDEWERVGQTLDRIEAGYHWWRGDWLLYGERRYGQTYAKALDPETGRYETLRAEAWVAERVPPERRTALPWSFHQAVARLEPAAQDDLLRRAAEEGWTQRALKQRVKALGPASVNRLTLAGGRVALSSSAERTIYERVTAGEAPAAVGADFGIDAHRVSIIVRQLRAAAERVPAPVPAPVPLPRRHVWRCLVIDPPWPMEKIVRDVHPDQGRLLDYPTMPVPEIVTGAPVPDLADPAGCHVYLWTTHRFLPAALWLFTRWGVRYECLMTWAKSSGFTPYSWMYDTEHVLFGRFGGDLPLERLGLRLRFEAPVTRHSAKPDVFYDRVREASPGPRLDLFARTRREGFEAWGNEAPGGPGRGEEAAG